MLETYKNARMMEFASLDDALVQWRFVVHSHNSELFLIENFFKDEDQGDDEGFAVRAFLTADPAELQMMFSQAASKSSYGNVYIIVPPSMSNSTHWQMFLLEKAAVIEPYEDCSNLNFIYSADNNGIKTTLYSEPPDGMWEHGDQETIYEIRPDLICP